MKIIWGAAVVLAILALASCSRAQGQDPDPASIRGMITQINLADDQLEGTLMVEGVIETDTSYDKASVRLTKKTKITKIDEAGKVQILSVKDLTEDMKVEMVFIGPVAESYPVQATAKSVTVLP